MTNFICLFSQVLCPLPKFAADDLVRFEFWKGEIYCHEVGKWRLDVSRVGTCSDCFRISSQEHTMSNFWQILPGNQWGWLIKKVNSWMTAAFSILYTFKYMKFWDDKWAHGLWHTPIIDQCWDMIIDMNI